MVLQITQAENNRHPKQMEMMREGQREKQQFHQAKLAAMREKEKVAKLSAFNKMARNIMDHEPGMMFEAAFARAKAMVDSNV